MKDGPATLDDESFLNPKVLAPMRDLRCPTESRDAARKRLFDNMAWVVRIIEITIVNGFNTFLTMLFLKHVINM